MNKLLKKERYYVPNNLITKTHISIGSFSFYDLDFHDCMVTVEFTWEHYCFGTWEEPPHGDWLEEWEVKEVITGEPIIVEMDEKDDSKFLLLEAIVKDYLYYIHNIIYSSKGEF